LLLDGNGQMSHCQNEAEDEDRATFEESEDEIEVEELYAVDEGMPIEFEVEGRGEIEGAMDGIEVEIGWATKLGECDGAGMMTGAGVTG
jgi:hypothetical protein